MKTVKTRKCITRLSRRLADGLYVPENLTVTWHGFFQIDAGEHDAGPVAVVELEDGTVTTVNADAVKFVAEAKP